MTSSGVKKQIFKSEVCEQVLARQDVLERHMKIHQGTKFSCSECDAFYSRQDKLEVHIQNKHDIYAKKKTTGFKVERRKSQQIVKTEHSLAKTPSVSKTKSLPLPTQITSSQSSTAPTNVSSVTNSVISRSVPLQTPNKIGDPPRLSVSTPSGDSSRNKRIKCVHCPNKFSNSMKLKEHVKTHTGPRYYKCDQCNSKFKVKENYVKHRHTKHVVAGIVIRKKIGQRIKTEHFNSIMAMECNDNHDFGEFIVDGLYLSDENQLCCRVRNQDCFTTKNLQEMKVHRETFHQVLERRIIFEKWSQLLPGRFLKMKEVLESNNAELKMKNNEVLLVNVPRDVLYLNSMKDEEQKMFNIDVAKVIKNVNTAVSEKVDVKKGVYPIKKEFGDLLVKLKHRYVGR